MQAKNAEEKYYVGKGGIMNFSDSFIEQTARDYDIEKVVVVKIYNRCKTSKQFYEQLEEWLKSRRNK